MESCLYTGRVSHRRTAHAFNEFSYRLFFLYLDLAELDRVFTNQRLWSLERSTWASFRRADHLRRPGPLDQAVRDLVASQLGFRPAGPVRLLTHLRYLGYCMNPISVYYCFWADGERLEAILCEVHNTPWGEEYLRALDCRAHQEDGDRLIFHLDKEFHVSPFMPMDIRYEWRFTLPGETLAVWMKNMHRGEKIFEARLELERRPLTSANLSWALGKWPFMTGKVIAAIYWQAARIWSKGVPFYPHPEPMQVTKGTYHP